MKKKINQDKLFQIESHVSEQVMKEFEATQKMFYHKIKAETDELLAN